MAELEEIIERKHRLNERERLFIDAVYDKHCRRGLRLTPNELEVIDYLLGKVRK